MRGRTPSPALPVDEVLDDLRDVLRRARSAVLIAPPGAGKTTRVPLALLDEGWSRDRRIVVLEPRRLAARAAATHMSGLLGEPGPGGTVGLRTRRDTRVSARTRVEIVTEGVLTRMLQTDPDLDGVACVVFDEFHERSLAADLGLALSLHARELLRPDLRMLVMSATLEGEPLAALLGQAPIVRSEGRAFEVETRFRPPSQRDSTPWGIARDTTDAVVEALDTLDGDVLVFLPGAGEIRRVAQLLDESHLPATVDVLPLFGRLGRSAQDQAIRPSVLGRRKVVLATSIAETSITIDGVRVVIDAGWMRVPRFDARNGLTRLETVRVTRDAADQRRGRAGRTAPGVCWRLWTRDEDHGLVGARSPQIREADLAPLALDLAAFGAEAGELRWLDPPPEAALAQAQELLRGLGLVDGDGRITSSGRTVAGIGAHPRLGRMLLQGLEWDALSPASALAAVVAEGDPLRGQGRAPAVDVSWRVELLDSSQRRARGSAPGVRVDARALAAAREEAARLTSRMRAASPERAEAAPPVATDLLGCLAAVAYPDRVGLRRADQRGRFVLSSGRGVRLFDDDPMAGEAALVALHLDGAGQDARIFLAARLETASIERLFADQIDEVREVVWDSGLERVSAVRERRFGSIVLTRGFWSEAPPGRVRGALCEGIREMGLAALPWTKELLGLKERLAFLHQVDPDHWSPWSDDVLLERLDDWLGPFLTGCSRRSDLRGVDLASALGARAGWDRMRQLDVLAPARIEVPSGSSIAVDYSDPTAPVLAVRLQEVFGWTETPRIAERVPLTLHLLSPASRPVQVTRDLASFWAGAYFDVRRDLRGRYPKHAWPEDPLAAKALRGVPRKRG